MLIKRINELLVTGKRASSYWKNGLVKFQLERTQLFCHINFKHSKILLSEEAKNIGIGIGINKQKEMKNGNA